MTDKDPSNWFAFAIEQGLKLAVLTPQQILGHATPDVLVAQLPREVTTRLLTTALSAGVLSPESLLETVSPATLAEHIEPNLLWHCLADAAASGELDREGGTSTEAGRKWLGEILRQALDEKLLTATDVVRFIPPGDWVRDAPLDVVAAMISAGLTRGTFNAELALNFLTPRVIAEHLKPVLAWRCLADVVPRSFGASPDAFGVRPPLAAELMGLNGHKLEPVAPRIRDAESADDLNTQAWDSLAVPSEEMLEIIDDLPALDGLAPPGPPPARRKR